MIEDETCDLDMNRNSSEHNVKSKDIRQEMMLTGMEIFLNMEIPLLTSVSATSCGVETITAPIAFQVAINILNWSSKQTNHQ